MFLVNEDGNNLISTSYLLQAVVAHCEKDTIKSGEEKIGRVQKLHDVGT